MYPTKKSSLAFEEVADSESECWQFRLYVAGQTPKSLAAYSNLRKLCEEYLAGKYEIEVIDLLVNPKLARQDQILAIPTLVKKLPPPERRVIGDLTNVEKVTTGFNMPGFDQNRVLM